MKNECELQKHLWIRSREVVVGQERNAEQRWESRTEF